VGLETRTRLDSPSLVVVVVEVGCYGVEVVLVVFGRVVVVTVSVLFELSMKLL
jgi:hypothetical protein